MSQQAAICQLYAILEAGPGAAAGERLTAALANGEIACVLIAPAGEAALAAEDAAPLVAQARAAGLPALILNDHKLARAVQADGMHIGPSDRATARLDNALAALGPAASIGADAGGSRDDAMTLGEMGAAYIAFSAPPVATPEDDAVLLEEISWWAEIFEVPCVAFDIATPEQAAALAAAGADFVALRIAAGTTPADAGARVKAFAAAVDNATGPA